MAQQLKQAFRGACGDVEIGLAYTPSAPIAALVPHGVASAFDYRFEVTLTAKAGPHGQRVVYQSPTPTPFYLKVFSKTREGLVDVTNIQVDTPHTGGPEPQDVVLTAPGEPWVDRIAYPAIGLVVATSDLRPGDYVLRFMPHTVVQADGKHCEWRVPDLPLRLTAG